MWTRLVRAPVPRQDGARGPPSKLEGEHREGFGAPALLLRQLSSSTAESSLVDASAYAAGARGGAHAQAARQGMASMLVNHRAGQELAQSPVLSAGHATAFDAALAEAHQFYRAGDYISALSKCNDVRPRDEMLRLVCLAAVPIQSSMLSLTGC